VTRHPVGALSGRAISDAVSPRYPARLRGTAPASSPIVLETVFEYRKLLGKCELGYGLDLDEIARVEAIERAFAPKPDGRRRRKFRRAPVELHATLRGDRINDPVDVIELGPGGLVCRNAPFIARGEQVEVVIDDGDTSYRFRAQGVWLRDDGEDYRVGLQLIGMPVCLRHVRFRSHQQDLVDRIVAAAA
jgi:hypothetical protein